MDLFPLIRGFCFEWFACVSTPHRSPLGVCGVQCPTHARVRYGCATYSGHLDGWMVADANTPVPKAPNPSDLTCDRDCSPLSRQTPRPHHFRFPHPWPSTSHHFIMHNRARAIDFVQETQPAHPPPPDDDASPPCGVAAAARRAHAAFATAAARRSRRRAAEPVAGQG